MLIFISIRAVRKIFWSFWLLQYLSWKWTNCLFQFLNLHLLANWTKITSFIPANFFTDYVGVTFFILRVPRFFVGSDNIRRCPKMFRRRYEEFRLTQTWEHKGTLTSLLKKETSEKVDHPHRLFFSLFGSGFFK